MRKIVIGVMGPGIEAKNKDIQNAYELGRLIAKEGWMLLSGGINKGIMDAVNKGAKEEDGLTIGIIPTTDPKTISNAVDIAIITNMGSARNNINVLSSDVIIACGMSPGTASEIALALKAKKKVILLNDNDESKVFFKNLGKDNVMVANNPRQTIEITKKLLYK